MKMTGFLNPVLSKNDTYQATDFNQKRDKLLRIIGRKEMLSLIYFVKNNSKGGNFMRKYYIDNIRSFTIILVVFYHVIYMFNSVITAGVIGPITNAPWLDTVQYLLYPWFMLILFIISGMCSRFYLENHSNKEFFRARTRKLLVPSTIGLLVFGWVQGYFNMAIGHAFDNITGVPAPVMYLIMCISGTGVLWTIQVMWVLSLILLLVRKLEKDRLIKYGAKANILVLILLGIIVWGASHILNTPVIVVYRFGIYGIGFLFGYYIFSHEEVTDRLEKYAVPLLIAALLLGAAYTYFTFGQNYAEAPAINSPLAISYAWMMCLAVTGCFKKWRNGSNKFSMFVSGKSFGLYVFHYLTLSSSAYFLTRYTNLPASFIYLLVTIAAFAGGVLLYEIISRIPVIRWCVLGIKRETKRKKEC